LKKLVLKKNILMNFIYDKEYNTQRFSIDELNKTDYENCTFIECDFRSCLFQGITFIECKFINCNFEDAKINHVSFREVWFTKCNFTNVNFAMTDQVIHEFHFKDCLLDYSKFYKLKLRKIQFLDCSLVSADFMATDLTEAVFANCNLRLAVFIDTIANKVDFSTSHYFSIDPDKNKLKKAIFSLEGLRGLVDKYDLIIK
jgi:uncharacterized protein YjbI with pentapeptide repeats